MTANGRARRPGGWQLLQRRYPCSCLRQFALKLQASLYGKIRRIHLAREGNGDEFSCLRVTGHIAHMSQLKQVVFKLGQFLRSHRLSRAVVDDVFIAPDAEPC